MISAAAVQPRSSTSSRNHQSRCTTALLVLQADEPVEQAPCEDYEVEDITVGMHNLSTTFASGPMGNMPRLGGPRKRALIVGCSYK